jgi:8-oxo-dGTP diphosphatase
MNQSLIYKAGIVPYRKKQNRQDIREIEILTISSRKYPGQWVFPVGTVEKDEIIEEAAVRECREESGYNVELGRKIATFTISVGNTPAEFIFFYGLVISKEKTWEDDRELHWQPLDNVAKIIAEPFKKVAEIAIKEILSW